MPSTTSDRLGRHDASREMLYTAGQLPRNVSAPEWILFGMGSFFEFPTESPWGGPGGANAYYLPRFKDLQRRNKLERTSLETLRRVVTDSYFHQRGAILSGETTDAAERKARATAWSLTYFLAHKRLDSLFRYFEELSKMPRDLELDEASLLICFARAFGAVDANQRVDDAKFSALAQQWYTYVNAVPVEGTDIQKAVRDYLREMSRRPPTPPGGGLPGQGGAGTPGSGGTPPGT